MIVRSALSALSAISVIASLNGLVAAPAKAESSGDASGSFIEAMTEIAESADKAERTITARSNGSHDHAEDGEFED